MNPYQLKLIRLLSMLLHRLIMHLTAHHVDEALFVPVGDSYPRLRPNLGCIIRVEDESATAVCSSRLPALFKVNEVYN
jgi:hypothetical protein